MSGFIVKILKGFNFHNFFLRTKFVNTPTTVLIWPSLFAFCIHRCWQCSHLNQFINRRIIVLRLWFKSFSRCVIDVWHINIFFSWKHVFRLTAGISEQMFVSLFNAISWHELERWNLIYFRREIIVVVICEDLNFLEANWKTLYSPNKTKDKVIGMFEEKLFRQIIDFLTCGNKILDTAFYQNWHLSVELDNYKRAPCWKTDQGKLLHQRQPNERRIHKLSRQNFRSVSQKVSHR